MQDTVYQDEMAHFDRERIPERVVHAKGAGKPYTLTVEYLYITQLGHHWDTIGTPLGHNWDTIGTGCSVTQHSKPDRLKCPEYNLNRMPLGQVKVS